MYAVIAFGFYVITRDGGRVSPESHLPNRALMLSLLVLI